MIISEQSRLILERRQLIEAYSLNQADINLVMQTITAPDPNAEMGIDPQFIPPFILNTFITNKAKYVIIPPELDYQDERTESVPGWNGWQWIRADLSKTDKKRFIEGVKLGNGTAWEEGLSIGTEESAPEWRGLVEYFSEYLVDNPNYPLGKSPAKLIPSIAYPPPSLRAAIGMVNGNTRGTPFEMLLLRRHETSHVIEMLLWPWPMEGSDNLSGFPQTDSQNDFLTMLLEYGLTIDGDSILPQQIEYIKQSGFIPRSYVGELQSYLGDLIYLVLKFKDINSEEYLYWKEVDMLSAHILLVQNGRYKN